MSRHRRGYTLLATGIPPVCRDTCGTYSRGGIIVCVATQGGVYHPCNGYTYLCVATHGGHASQGDDLLCRDTGGGIPPMRGVYPPVCRDTGGSCGAGTPPQVQPWRRRLGMPATHGRPPSVVVPSMHYPSGSSNGSVPRMNSENNPQVSSVRPILGKQIAPYINFLFIY